MFKKYFILGLFLLPMAVFAQLNNINDLFLVIGRLINLLLPLVVALALLFFFWGLARFVLAAGEEVDKQKGKDMMIWGVVALFVMVSVWGLVAFIVSALDIEENPSISVPTIDFSSGTISTTPSSSGPSTPPIPSRSSCPPGQVCL